MELYIRTLQQIDSREKVICYIDDMYQRFLHLYSSSLVASLVASRGRVGAFDCELST